MAATDGSTFRFIRISLRASTLLWALVLGQGNGGTAVPDADQSPLIAAPLRRRFAEDVRILESEYFRRWCGPRCLWSLANRLGKEYEFSEVLLACQASGADGGISSLQSLVGAAESLDLSAKLVRGATNDLCRLAPAITVHHVAGSAERVGTALIFHAKVFGGCDGEDIWLLDPAEGNRF